MRASVALLLCACNSDFEIQQGKDANAAAPAFSVSPVVLSLEAPLGDIDTGIITLSNDGDAALALLGAEVVSGARFSVGALGTTRLAPGESVDLVVTFEALVTEELGTLQLYSDDSTLEVAEVQLSGRALTPLLAVEPDPVAFGSRTIGCDWDIDVSLFNDGDADLHVEQVLASGDRFSLTSAEVPPTLTPGESAQVSVRYSPLEPVASVGGLVVGSDDPGGDRQVTISGTGAEAALTEQAYQQGFDVREDIDILVYIDKSGSMGDDNARLKDNAERFMTQLTALDTNYQLMVVTEDFGCHNESIITPATASPVAVFSRALDGPAGGLTESGLSVVLEALEESGSGGCNAGFLRDDVALSVILISDEPEQSSAGWASTLDEVLAVEPDTIISAIAGDYPTSACETAEAGDGYYQATVKTGGVFLSICETDWGAHIDAISDISTKVPGEITDTFYLSDYPDPSTIEVLVDDVLSTGWQYDPKRNAVVFDTPPADEAYIYVTFTRGCGG